ncbi:unnamed protein product [Rangifer tarandus platyrhynchus]|uniref:Uncharacterized protein n=1 Tax=Rangifer tarandus platyrhynchus TaxID=3082113 RepID=A0AC59Y152_RANTA
MKCSLGISNFLEEISSLSHSVVFLYFFAWITEEGLLSFFFFFLLETAGLYCKITQKSHGRSSSGTWQSTSQGQGPLETGYCIKRNFKNSWALLRFIPAFHWR